MTIPEPAWHFGVVYSVNGNKGFWAIFKNSIRSTHIHISEKHIDRYLSEFTFRQNHRQRENAMFDLQGRGAERLAAALALIEFEWAGAMTRPDKRLHVAVSLGVIWTHR